MNVRKMLVRVALAIIGLPVAAVLIAVLTIRAFDRTNGTIVSSGQKREYLLYVPSSYDRTRPASLVISLHGAAGWPAQQMHVSRWNRLADSAGFIVVYPAGEQGGPRFWHVERGSGLMRDVRFISDLIDTLESSYNIDRTRIYVNGLSNGGGMAFVLSCRLSGRIAAVGMVSAAQSLPWNWCTDRRPVPMIAFHGTADPMVPYDGGLSGDPINPLQFPSVRDWTAHWARRNGCDTIPVDSALSPDVIRRVYTHCADDAGVELYTIKGAGHQWPGGKAMPEWLVGRPSEAIDATARLWAFFAEHRLQR